MEDIANGCQSIYFEDRLLTTYLYYRLWPPTLLLTCLCCGIGAVARLWPRLNAHGFFALTACLCLWIGFKDWCTGNDCVFRAIFRNWWRTTTVLITTLCRTILTITSCRPRCNAKDLRAVAGHRLCCWGRRRSWYWLRLDWRRLGWCAALRSPSDDYHTALETFDKPGTLECSPDIFSCIALLC